MDVKFTFIKPSNGHTTQLVVKVTCDSLPLIMSGNHWLTILPIDDYQIIEKESTDDYKDVFEIKGILNKTQLIVKPTNRTNFFFMAVPEVTKQQPHKGA